MQWSRYNLLFESKRNGWLLYNSVSNSFVQMEDDAAEFIKKVKDNPDMDFSAYPDLYFKLRYGGFLVEDGKDDDFIRILKMRRLSANYKGEWLSLTIAITKECNFACGYCYENNRVPSKITDDTEGKLIEFIKKHKHIKGLFITWYGGEPLLEYERMKSLNSKIKDSGIKYRSMMVTNGYCLTSDIISSLPDFNMTQMQITIDGSKSTHNKRRVLIGGGETYDKIIENIDMLMQSDWKGFLSVRVNVDATNSSEFMDIFTYIKEKYPEKLHKQIGVYPGFVTDDQNPDISCHFNSESKGRFIAELAEKHNVTPLSIFPRRLMGGCTMTRQNAYVVGPDGELYKCWHELGNKQSVVGRIDEFTNWNMSLIAEGMVGASYLDNETCGKCFFFPVCDGGCPRVRMLNNRDGGKRDTCSYFKKYSKELLEIYYEQKESGHMETMV